MPRALFASETFYDSHGRVAYAVLEGEADVGATFAVYERCDPRRRLVSSGFREVLPGRDGRVLDATGPIPSDMIVAVPDLSSQVRAALTLALQRIHEQPEASAMLQALFGIDGFQPFSASSKPALQALVDVARDVGSAPPLPYSDELD